MGNFLGSLIAAQHRPHILQVISNLPRRLRDIPRPEATGNFGRFLIVLLLTGGADDGPLVAQMRGHKAAAFGDVYPGQQVRIAGLIGRAVFVLAAYPQMDPLYFRNQPFGIGGAAQAAKDIFTEI